MIALNNATVAEPGTESVINRRRLSDVTVTEQRLTMRCATTAGTPVNVSSQGSFILEGILSENSLRSLSLLNITHMLELRNLSRRRSFHVRFRLNINKS